MQSIAPAPHTPKGFMGHQDLSQEQSLREHLLHHVNDPNQSAAASNQRTQIGAHAPQTPVTAAHNIDPAIAGPGAMGHSPGESGGDENGIADSGKKSGKRELSTSKRAAQNRAAQRAFRQRKEGHIKKLEEQVRDAQQLHESFKALERENFTLREYIISLQGRLIEVGGQGELPPAPSNINLQRPLSSSSSGAAPPSSGEYVPAPTAPMSGNDAMLQQSAAQAVAGLARESNTDPALTAKPARS